MNKIDNDKLEEARGGSSLANANLAADISVGKYLKNKTNEHYFKITGCNFTDIRGVSCWMYYDGSIDKNTNATLHKADAHTYYRNIDKGLLPDWVKSIFGD